MAYNRYRGNTGRRERVETPEPGPRPIPPPPEPSRRESRPPGPPPVRRGSPGGRSPGQPDPEDWLVAGILWLLYRASGDTELLLAMGAYLFL